MTNISAVNCHNCTSRCLRHPGPVDRGAEAAEELLEATEETAQRTERPAEEAPQEGGHTPTVWQIHQSLRPRN